MSGNGWSANEVGSLELAGLSERETLWPNATGYLSALDVMLSILLLRTENDENT